VPACRQTGLLAMMEKAGRENNNNCGFQLWQQHNNPILLATQQMMHQKLTYLRNNPVEAGFIEKAEDWLYSSANDYYTGKRGMIDILVIDPIIITY
jgi:hypothetical protein